MQSFIFSFTTSLPSKNLQRTALLGSRNAEAAAHADRMSRIGGKRRVECSGDRGSDIADARDRYRSTRALIGMAVEYIIRVEHPRGCCDGRKGVDPCRGPVYRKAQCFSPRRREKIVTAPHIDIRLIVRGICQCCKERVIGISRVGRGRC